MIFEIELCPESQEWCSHWASVDGSAGNRNTCLMQKSDHDGGCLGVPAFLSLPTFYIIPGTELRRNETVQLGYQDLRTEGEARMDMYL